jgi:hypothetical protein
MLKKKLDNRPRMNRVSPRKRQHKPQPVNQETSQDQRKKNQHDETNTQSHQIHATNNILKINLPEIYNLTQGA